MALRLRWDCLGWLSTIVGAQSCHRKNVATFSYKVYLLDLGNEEKNEGFSVTVVVLVFFYK